MDVTVTGRHVNVTGAMKQYAREKIIKCDKFRPPLTSAHIVMNVEKFRHKVEITASSARHLSVHVEAVSDDMYKSIDTCIDKLAQQLRKVKGKVQHHKTKDPFKVQQLREISLMAPSPEPEDEEAEEEAPLPLLHRQALARKPMSLDEAILEMQALNDDFLVFFNEKSQSPSVLYRITQQRCGHLKGPVKETRQGKITQTAEVYSLKDAHNPDFKPKKVAEKKVVLERLSVDQVPAQLAKMKKDYLVFVNAANQNLNVFYRRKDGRIGLIE